MKMAEAEALAPNFGWAEYFKGIGLEGTPDINVGQPDFFKAVNGYLTSIPLGDWKTYLRWRLIDTTAANFSKPFVEEDFDFKGRILTGTKENLPRWKRCVQGTDLALGEALGQFYVQKNFPPAAKERMLTLVKNMIAALNEDIKTLDWMSQPTRQQAITKLEAFFQKSIENKRLKPVDGFTPEQRFFLGFAQVWAGSGRPEYERLQTNTNPHPLPRFRVNGTVSNMPQFAQAFGCKAGDPMVRADRCRIW